jgi:hypothetical protein
MVDILIMAVINIISLSRFRDGGAAMLIARSRNHHIAIVGAIDIIPFVK